MLQKIIKRIVKASKVSRNIVIKSLKRIKKIMKKLELNFLELRLLRRKAFKE